MKVLRRFKTLCTVVMLSAAPFLMTAEVSQNQMSNTIVSHVRVTASNKNMANFGRRVALSGNFLFVSGTLWESKTQSYKDVVCVYKDDGGKWRYVQTLFSGEKSDGFGLAILATKKDVFISAPYGGVDGVISGVVYVYANSDKKWQPLERLVPGDVLPVEDFGKALAFSRSELFIGAPASEVSKKKDYGRVYVYGISRGRFHLKQLLTAEDTSKVDSFGESIGVDNGWLVIGAPGTYFKDSPSYGKVFIFNRSGTGQWVKVTSFTKRGLRGSPYLGEAVQFSGNQVFVSAPDANANGIEGSGTVFVLQRGSESNWKFRSNLTSGDFQANFGSTMLVAEHDLIIGAPDETVKGHGYTEGFVYVYGKQHNQLRLMCKLTSGNPDTAENFGTSIARNDKYLAVGAPGAIEDGEEIGAVYMFRMDGHGCPISRSQLSAN